jgi:hypothetical protein
VQEAKEIPSVKVLDAAIVPTKRSFPPRLILITAGTVLAMIAICAWLFARQSWQVIDPQDPGKQFAEEVVSTLRLKAERLVPAGAVLSRVLARIKKRSEPAPPRVEELLEEKPSTATELSRAARGGLE